MNELQRMARLFAEMDDYYQDMPEQVEDLLMLGYSEDEALVILGMA